VVAWQCAFCANRDSRRAGYASIDRGQRFLAQRSQNSEYLLTTYRLKPFQKLVDGITGLEVFEEGAQGNARFSENRRATLNFWVALHESGEFVGAHNRKLLRHVPASTDRKKSSRRRAPN
jgi:hypothetical protein